MTKKYFFGKQKKVMWQKNKIGNHRNGQNITVLNETSNMSISTNRVHR